MPRRPPHAPAFARWARPRLCCSRCCRGAGGASGPCACRAERCMGARVWAAFYACRWPSGTSRSLAERRMGPVSWLPAMLPVARPHQQPVRELHCAPHGGSRLLRPTLRHGSGWHQRRIRVPCQALHVCSCLGCFSAWEILRTCGHSRAPVLWLPGFCAQTEPVHPMGVKEPPTCAPCHSYTRSLLGHDVQQARLLSWRMRFILRA